MKKEKLIFFHRSSSKENAFHSSVIGPDEQSDLFEEEQEEEEEEEEISIMSSLIERNHWLLREDFKSFLFPLSKMIVNQLIEERWLIEKAFSSGSFGVIYQGINVLTKEKVAIKFEPIDCSHPQLYHESEIYRSIEGRGIPKMFWFGTVQKWRAIILEMLGPSIEDLYNYCQRKFSMKTVLLLGEQMLERICHLHRRSVIHRDIKPDNFTMGIQEKSHSVYLIDFGLSKFYFNRRTHQHIEYADEKSFRGTNRFASLRTHAGIEQSRRDDLESLAYTLIYLARSDHPLPWQGVRGSTKKEKQEKIYEIKLKTPSKELCRNLPKELEDFLLYTRQLAFAEEPNYIYLFSLLKQIYQTMNIENDLIYDWIDRRSD